MGAYEQMEMDLRLDYERSLKDNLMTVTDFTGKKRQEELAEQGRPLKTVTSKQEAYGLMAQEFLATSQCFKVIKGQMDDFLKILDGDDGATTSAGNIYNSAIMLAQQAVIMASEAKRILSDLYYEPITPLEAYAAEQEGEEFQEVEE